MSLPAKIFPPTCSGELVKIWRHEVSCGHAAHKPGVCTVAENRRGREALNNIS
jgi:hypothetical protein